MKKLAFLFFAKKALLFALLFTPLFASAAPAFSQKFGNAIGGVLEHKAIKRGFAVNDPRFNATLAAVGSAITVVAGGVAATAGAPLWLTIAVTAAASAAVSLAADSIYKWIFEDDGTVSTDSFGSVVTDSGLQPGMCYTWTGEPQICTGTAESVCGSLRNSQGESLVWGFAYGRGPGCVDPGIANEVCGSPSNSNCPWGYPTQQPGTPIAQPGEGALKHVPAETAAGSIPTDVMNSPVNPAIIADAANKYWQEAAAQPGYQGLPYSYTDPVTSADVQAWHLANPDSYPSVSDAVTSPINPSTGSVPISTPSQATNPTPGIPTAPEGSPKLDLGVDPGIGSPNLEATPTGAQVLAPITNLMPDLRNFQVPAHQGECPKPEFDISVLQTRVRMDAQCTLFEEVRGPLYNGSLIAWIIAALFIVLSA